MKFKSNKANVLKELTRRQEQAAEAVGLFVKGQVVLKTPVAQKGGGNLRKSNDYRVKGTTVTIGNSAEYAIYQEKGTRHMPAQPFLYPAVMENKNNIKEIVSRYMRG